MHLNRSRWVQPISQSQMRMRGLVAGALSIGRTLCCLAGMTAYLCACAGMQKTTADTVEHDVQLQQQQAEQKSPVPDDRKLYLSLIQAMQTKGLFYASLAHIDAFERKYGVAPDVELLRGDALRETGQNAAALSAYRGAVASADTGAHASDAATDAAAHAQHGIGRVMAAEGDYPRAIDALNQAVVLNPTNIDFLNDLGFAYLASGQTPLARLPIAKAAELGPDNKKVIANLALYLLLSGNAAGGNDVMVRAKLSDQTVQATRSLAQQLQAASSARTAPAMAAIPPSQANANANANVASLSASNGPANRLSVPIANAPAWRNDSMLDRFGAMQ